MHPTDCQPIVSATLTHGMLHANGTVTADADGVVGATWPSIKAPYALWSAPSDINTDATVVTVVSAAKTTPPADNG